MTGAILGGSSVEQAAKLQMVIMFMISASTALASIVTTVLALALVVDGEHRVRSDRIDARKHVVWRARDDALARIGQWLLTIWNGGLHGRHSAGAGPSNEGARLLPE